jgi:type III restriction enzyme
VLSLFFIDVVEYYRSYTADGAQVKGKYAVMFEEEYRKAAAIPKYRTLFNDVDLESDATEVHDGYFSIDKKGTWTDTAENNQGNRENAERAYNLIMREKEKLLGFETKLKFIFSHSALREGWDNPNVFQICTLRDIRSERERRQTIGRGLRLCVDQNGARVRGFDTNTLTVIAAESYQQFAAGLQKEIEEATGIRFGIVEAHQFAGLVMVAADGTPVPMGMEQSRAIWEHLRDRGHIDAHGRVQETLKAALRDGTLSVPLSVVAEIAQINGLLRRLAGRVEILDADERRSVKPRPTVLLSDDFASLWDRIKHKTAYRVHFDNERLVDDCVRALRDAPPIARARLQWRKADIAIGKAGVEAVERAGASTVVLSESGVDLPDILTELQKRTQLTRRTIQRVLSASGRLHDFPRNPQHFIDLAAAAMNRCKRLAIVTGIVYQRLGDEHYYGLELFDEEMVGYLHRVIPDNECKSAYDHVLYDSGVEASFVEQLERNSDVKVFAKLPPRFVIMTPLGKYNPDWAVLVEVDGRERLYFVVETKGSLVDGDLREAEQARIACGRAHFRALRVMEPPAEYTVARTFEDVMNYAASLGNP